MGFRLSCSSSAHTGAEGFFPFNDFPGRHFTAPLKPIGEVPSEAKGWSRLYLLSQDPRKKRLLLEFDDEGTAADDVKAGAIIGERLRLPAGPGAQGRH